MRASNKIVLAIVLAGLLASLPAIVLAGLPASLSAGLPASLTPPAADLRAVPRLGDSSFMYFNRRESVDRSNLATFGVPSPTPAYTVILWACCETGDTYSPWCETLISTEPALYASEGGDLSPDLLGGAFWPRSLGGAGSPLPLSSTATFATNCLPATYDIPLDNPALDDWRFGCYTLNLITDSDLTVTVGGAERNVAASNDMQQLSFKCVASDRSITVAADDPDAEVFLCAAEAPLHQFHSVRCFDAQNDYIVLRRNEKSLTNEWRMVVLRAAITGSGASVTQQIQNFALDGVSPIEDSSKTEELWKPRADQRFARHSRIGFVLCRPGGLKINDRYMRRNVWGAKYFPEWLPDDLILAIHDKDRAEMSRRHMPPIYDFN